MNKEIDLNKKFANNITNRERAAFELGIKLGALFHISMGIPISKNDTTINSIEKALENSIKTQPYVNEVKVKLNREKIVGKKENEFDYSSINPPILSAIINVEYKNVRIKGRLEWDEKNKYPIMFIEDLN